MEATLFTVHRKGERGMQVVGDRFSTLAVLLWPAWVVWHGLWITGVATLAVLVAASAISSSGFLVVSTGIGLVFALEGASVRRFELRLRRWREAAVVEARSEAGAEELYLTGQAT